MGCYVNPQSESKESFLSREGIPLGGPPQDWDAVASRGEQLPVCLVDNGPFTAAGVAYSKREFEAFTLDRDHRPKKWYIVPISKLREVSDIDDYLG